MTPNNEYAQAFIDTNYEDLAGYVMQNIDIKNDYELIKSFAQLNTKIVKKCNPAAIGQSKHLKGIVMLFCNFLTSTIENDANTEIVFFLNDLICHTDTHVRNTASEYIEYVGTAFIVAIPNMRSVVSQTFAK